MLLAEESHTIQYLPRPRARSLEATLQVCVFFFKPVDPFRVHSGTTGSGIDRLDARLGRKGAAPECRQLVAKMPHELVQLLEGFDVRTFAV
jgi:hypothetical protein